MKPIKTKEIGTAPNGEPVQSFILNSGNGCQVSVCEYGAAMTSVVLQKKSAAPQEVILGYDTLEGHLNDTASMGVTVGRYANRIAHASFSIDGKIYPLDSNIPPHQIHGGSLSFGKRYWSGKIIESADAPTVEFSLLSQDGDMGYPGNLNITTTYSLSTDNVLNIEYQATCDADTYVNITNHAYFNLGRENHILDHHVTIHSDRTTPLNSDFLVTGEIASCEETVFDLTTPTSMRTGLENPDPQMKSVGGYDINYVIGDDDGVLKNHAEVHCFETGLSLKIMSTQPCLQFYTGNNLTGNLARDGEPLMKHAAFCLEAQDYPNGMNIDAFPTDVLKAGQEYNQTIQYHFLGASISETGDDI